MASESSAERDAAARWADALAFLQALGRDPKTCRLRAFYHSQNPKKVGDKGAKGAATSANVERWQEQGRGVYVVVNPGGDSDAAITSCCAFFCEFDDRPKVDQIKFWEALGLPEPSIQVDTGGKSIHSYWVLDVPVEPERWRDIQTRLLDFANADRTLKNPSRVMRLPGTRHAGPDGKLGAACEVININDARYVAGDIEACLPDPVEEKQRESYREPERRSMAEIGAALDCIPAAVPKQGQYAFYRTLLWGLIAACEEVGGGADEAIAMMKRHSPEFREVEACGRYQFSRVGPWTFWYLAKQHGWQPERAPRRVIETPKREREREDADPFACLGFCGTEYYFQPGDSGQVTKLSFKSVSSSAGLMMLAGLNWWRGRFPQYGKDGEQLKNPDWLEAANYVIRKSNAVGAYDDRRIRGIGAWWDQGRVVFHLGDRLLFDGEWYSSLKPPPSTFIYQRQSRLEGPGDAKPLTDDEGKRLLLVAESFHWQSPANGVLLAGFVALAPIAGALTWRPHIWVTGKKGQGKSTVKTHFVTPLLGDLACTFVGKATEAGIRQTLQSDSRPVVFDEIETNTQRDVNQVKAILDLVRVSSSAEGGRIVKGTPGGQVLSFEPRSMFMFCSINTALRQANDTSRFSVLELRSPDELSHEQAEAHWAELNRELAEFCTVRTGNRLISRMVQMVPVVRAAIDVFVPLAAAHFGGRRDGDQIGALLAGAWCLEHGEAPTPEEAQVVLDGLDLSAHGSEASGDGADEYQCLRAMMEARVRLEAGGAVHQLLMAELVALAAGRSPHPVISPDIAGKELSRYGMRVLEGSLAVANNSRGLRELLKGEVWADVGWKRTLGALPGARARGQTWFPCANVNSRAVAIPLALVLEGSSD